MASALVQWINKNVDDHKFFEDFVKLRGMTERAGEIRGICPIHGDADNPTSFRYSVDSKTFSCFSHHCEQQFGRSLVGLVRGMQHCSYYKAIREIEGFIGQCYDGEDAKPKEERQTESDEMWEKSWSNMTQELDVHKSLNELMVRRYSKDVHPYFLGRGFSEETLRHFEVGFADDGPLEGRVTIPIRDEADRLVMLSGRLPFDNAEEKSKYRHWAGCKKHGMLYNINNYVKSRATEMWVVEGFACVWRAYEFGLPNVVAIMGNSVAAQQATMIINKATDVVLALDNDDAGRNGISRAIKFLKDYVNIHVVDFKYKDIADYTSKEEFDAMVATKRKIV